MWSRLRKDWRRIDGQRMENVLKDGTPDVNHVFGWTEFKWLRAWPKKAEAIVQLKRFTVNQRNWLQRRWDVGGGSSLLLCVGGGRKAEWLLFPGNVAAESVGRVPRSDLIALAAGRWVGLPNRQQTIAILRGFNSRTSANANALLSGDGD